MEETVRCTYRLRPDRQAEAALLQERGRCRYLWNEAVHQQKTGPRETGPAPEAAGSIGIDWGVTTTATATDPVYDLPYRPPAPR